MRGQTRKANLCEGLSSDGTTTSCSDHRSRCRAPPELDAVVGSKHTFADWPETCEGATVLQKAIECCAHLREDPSSRRGSRRPATKVENTVKRLRHGGPLDTRSSEKEFVRDEHASLLRRMLSVRASRSWLTEGSTMVLPSSTPVSPAEWLLTREAVTKESVFRSSPGSLGHRA